MYDWANSSYNLVINTAIFPIYYTSITQSANSNGIVDFFGVEILNSVLYSYSLSFAYLVSVFLLPLLSGISDYSGRKMVFLKVFTCLGAFSCIGMFFFTSLTLEWGILCVISACVGYSTSLVFYDAYLPSIVGKKDVARVSGLGYAYGYAGSAILMIGSLALINYHTYFGFEDAGIATRTVFLLVGIWWIGWALIPFNKLTNIQTVKNNGNVILQGYYEIRDIFQELKGLASMKWYLLSFFFFNMGVKTVMLMATLFASIELDLRANQLIPILLIIQFLAMIGSIGFARLSAIKGNIFSLSVMGFIWAGVCVWVFFITEPTTFYFLTIIVGLVMGGSQALARATFARLVPNQGGHETSFYSFFDVVFHLSTVFGMLGFGLINQLTGSMRNSSFVLAGFFILSLILLLSKVQMDDERTATA